MKKEIQELKDREADTLLKLFRTTLRKYLIGKLQAMIESMDSGFKNSRLLMTDWLFK